MDDKPDRLELGLRFGCGAAFGLAVGLIAALRWSWRMDWPLLLLIVLGTALVFGLLARARGDEFWWSVLERWRR